MAKVHTQGQQGTEGPWQAKAAVRPVRLTTISNDIQVAIATELRRAVRLLKADPNEVLPIGIDREILYQVFEQLGAKSDLLAIIGSYGTMPDYWVRDQLRRWNAASKP